MDLNYAPEDLAFREATRQWFATNTPAEDLKTLDERKAWHRRMYEAGYVGMLWPKEIPFWGGRTYQLVNGTGEQLTVLANPGLGWWVAAIAGLLLALAWWSSKDAKKNPE